MPPNKDNKRQSESGNIFLFIMLGVVLFATLSFTVARGFRSDNTSAMSKRQADLAATNILNFANQIERSVNRLRRNGCSENQISFQRDVNNSGTITNNLADHYNANAPTDNSCHIYNPDGGKITYKNIENLDFVGSGSNRIQDLGCSTDTANCIDLVISVKDIPVTICESINKQLNIDDIPEDTIGNNFQFYRGTFTTSGIVGNTDARLAGTRTACYLDTDDNVYIFYLALIER